MADGSIALKKALAKRSSVAEDNSDNEISQFCNGLRLDYFTIVFLDYIIN